MEAWAWYPCIPAQSAHETLAAAGSISWCHLQAHGTTFLIQAQSGSAVRMRSLVMHAGRRACQQQAGGKVLLKRAVQVVGAEGAVVVVGAWCAAREADVAEARAGRHKGVVVTEVDQLPAGVPRVGVAIFKGRTRRHVVALARRRGGRASARRAVARLRMPRPPVLGTTHGLQRHQGAWLAAPSWDLDSRFPQRLGRACMSGDAPRAATPTRQPIMHYPTCVQQGVGVRVSAAGRATASVFGPQ